MSRAKIEVHSERFSLRNVTVERWFMKRETDALPRIFSRYLFFLPLAPALQISRFEVTWLGLHAFWKVFDALAARQRCFARPAADVRRALVETETRNRLLQQGHKHPKETVDGGAPGAKILPRRSRSHARLQAVVRERDAVDLQVTLTRGSW